MIGDQGGVTAPRAQNAVSYAMQRHAGATPAFVYSVGDWVYFGGDEAGWDHQFYEAYSHFPVPFVGIPGETATTSTEAIRRTTRAEARSTGGWRTCAPRRL